MVDQRLVARLRREDEGQLLLLVLCYAVIAGLLVTVVVDTSKTYLCRRSLVAAADGAALAAANQPDLAEVYGGAGGPALPISGSAAEAAVARYAADAELAQRFDGFHVVGVTTDGETVTVTLRAAVRMPLLNLLSAGYRGGYPVEASATARSPFTG